ncbi:MAG: hypothetical protein HY303_15485, partial [Candidatus Wallbacteria bacterium]|nr:hypothetical protein [Candidatus Wallbacteria bacterium]
MNLLPEALAFVQSLATLPPGMRIRTAGESPAHVRVSDLVVPLADPFGADLSFGIDLGTEATRFTIEQTGARPTALTIHDVALAAKLPA